MAGQVAGQLHQVAQERVLLPHLRERGSGTIVQISSMGGQVTMPGFGLALGNDAVDAIAAHHARLGDDLRAWEKVSRGTDLGS